MDGLIHVILELVGSPGLELGKVKKRHKKR